MDNRTIEEVRENETKLIDEIKQLEKENKKYKEVIDKLKEYLVDNIPEKFVIAEYDVKKIKDILKEVD